MNTAAQQETWPDKSQVNPGTKPDASLSGSRHPNPDAVEHAQIGSVDRKEGGKDMGLVNAPTVSMHPTSEPQGDSDEVDYSEHRIIDNANLQLNHYLPELGHVEFKYPFQDLEFNQGMFIPVEENSSTDALMAKIYKQVDQYRKQNSEIERDENGDDVMEDVCINVKKRNEDGTVQLDGDKPRLEVKSGFRPKLVGPNFIVKAVVKGDKIGENEEADSDGALIIRLG
jgi:hypothetical protein